MSKRNKEEEESTSKICEFPADSDAEELKRLVKDPAYVCKSCGRSAASDENLCQPERFYSAW